MTILTQASAQWASRPADQRFLSLHELGAKVGYERDRSAERVVANRKVQFQPAKDDPIRGIELLNPENGKTSIPTHWSFGQLASLSGAPAGYLRKLPAPLAADCLNYGLKIERDVEDVGLLFTRQENHVELRAATGPRYGRIWNSDIVNALVDRFGDGRTGHFRVPGEFGQQVDVNRQNTTIYGSDRDIFVFLADEENRIEMSNRRDGKSGSLARGFFVWNSEVGSQSIGAAFFLFDYVCMNRIVWGVQDFKEIRLRHTVSAPDKWLGSVAPILQQYANASAAPIEATIKAAQQAKVDSDLDAFLKTRFGLGKAEIGGLKEAHDREEGRPIETLWDVTTAVTAYAKTIEYQDERVSMERIGGKVLDLVAVN